MEFLDILDLDNLYATASHNTAYYYLKYAHFHATWLLVGSLSDTILVAIMRHESD